MEIKYGEKEILEFDINNKENFWSNEHDELLEKWNDKLVQWQNVNKILH